MRTRHYPKFLKLLPETMGIGFHELFFIIFVLLFSAFLELRPVSNIVLILLGIVFIKIVKKYFDFVGWLLPKKKQLFITDYNGGEK